MINLWLEAEWEERISGQDPSDYRENALPKEMFLASVCESIPFPSIICTLPLKQPVDFTV